MTAPQVRALVEAGLSAWVPRGLAGPTSDELRAVCRDAGWRFVEIKLAGIGDKAGLMRALGQQCDLPDHFGANWDAFEECLGDLVAQSPGTVIRLKGLAHLTDGLAEPLVEILDDAVGLGGRVNADGEVADDPDGAAVTAPDRGARPVIVVADPPLPVRR